MSRIEFAGRGGPIPGIALPDPNLDTNLPTQLLILEDGIPFQKADWTAFGYTHYEVWCIGGAGGRGGDLDGGYCVFDSHAVATPMPSNVWEAYVYSASKGMGDVFAPEYGGLITYRQFLEYRNPGHIGYIVTYSNPRLWSDYVRNEYPNQHSENLVAWGGAGGGGGLHVVGGELADLPDICPVEVGQAGVDAPVGQGVSSEPYAPTPQEMWLLPSNYPGFYGNPPPYLNVQMSWGGKYPEPHGTILPPQPGGDGGTSSFGGDICQASGGKGGEPSLIWVPHSDSRWGVPSPRRHIHGHGGEGGAGDRAAAGGGGAGGKYEDTFKIVRYTVGDRWEYEKSVVTPPKEGTWDGTIGKGGGGGAGGCLPSRWRPYDHDYDAWYNWYASELVDNRINLEIKMPSQHKATGGGRGSFSYADTSVYGQRQVPGPPVLWDDVSGGYGYQPHNYISIVVEPGGGGGARANRKWAFGSDAQTYSDKGLVLLRLIKID